MPPCHHGIMALSSSKASSYPILSYPSAAKEGKEQKSDYYTTKIPGQAQEETGYISRHVASHHLQCFLLSHT